ncbi:MAG: hypothetical protein AB4058_13645 [Microcystaceae cyanobacterium]
MLKATKSIVSLVGFSLFSLTTPLMTSHAIAQQVIIIPDGGGSRDPKLDRARLIIETLRGREDIRNISLQTDYNDIITDVCYEEKSTWQKLVRHGANHPSAYQDGYGEGRLSAQRGDKYEPRTAGGEFGRGFDDGYYGNNNTGQNPNATVQDYYETYSNWNRKCVDV